MISRGRDTGALDHLDARSHGVSFNGSQVVGSDVDVDTQYLATRLFGVEADARFDCFAYIQLGQHRSAEDE